MKCPACDFENIEGSDVCDECGTSLTETQVKWRMARSGDRSISDSIGKAGMRTAIVVKPETPVSEVVREMRDRHRGCALIQENGKLVGLFTRRDVLHRVAKPGADLTQLEIRHVMSPSPEMLKEADTIGFALNKMSMGNYRHVPIVREDGSFSVFSVRDALRYFF